MHHVPKLFGGVLLLALFALASCDSAETPTPANLDGQPALAEIEPALADFNRASLDLNTESETWAEEARALMDAALAEHLGERSYSDGWKDYIGPFTVNLCDEATIEGTIRHHYPGGFDLYTFDLEGGTGDLAIDFELLTDDDVEAGATLCVEGGACVTVSEFGDPDADGRVQFVLPNVTAPVRASLTVTYFHPTPPGGRNVDYRLTGSFIGEECNPPPPEDCVACGTDSDPDADDADKVSELTMRYDGAEAALVEVYNDKDPDEDKLLFRGTLSPGEEFTIRASDLGEEKFTNDVGFFINGERDTKIHTSCSQPLGPGTVSGQFVVVSGKDKLGRPLCPDEPGSGCDCDGGVKQLTMRYDGDEAALVEVYNDNDNDDASKLLFSGMLSPGEEFTIRSSDLGEEDFNNNVAFYVDGQQDAEVHTSCSRPIGPNLMAGRFFVVSGIDKRGNMLCPLEPSANCDCEGGVKQLTMRYDGDSAAWVTVYNDGNADEDKILFSGMVAPGEEFSFMASTLGEDKFKSNISFYIEEVKDTELHTSCSRPIGEGQVIGEFVVVSGVDRMNNMLCPFSG